MTGPRSTATPQLLRQRVTRPIIQQRPKGSALLPMLLPQTVRLSPTQIAKTGPLPTAAVQHWIDGDVTKNTTTAEWISDTSKAATTYSRVDTDANSKDGITAFSNSPTLETQGDATKNTTTVEGFSITSNAATTDSTVITDANSKDGTTAYRSSPTLDGDVTKNTTTTEGISDTSKAATTDSRVDTDANSKGGTTAFSNSPTLDFSCFSCGRYRTNMKTECRSTTSKDLCSEVECWIYSKNDGNRVYARGCRSNDSTLTNFMCNDFESSTCKTVSGDQVCAKCCTSEDCNSGDLEDSNSGAQTPIGAFFIAAAVFVVLFTE